MGDLFARDAFLLAHISLRFFFLQFQRLQIISTGGQSLGILVGIAKLLQHDSNSLCSFSAQCTCLSDKLGALRRIVTAGCT